MITTIGIVDFATIIPDVIHPQRYNSLAFPIYVGSLTAIVSAEAPAGTGAYYSGLTGWQVGRRVEGRVAIVTGGSSGIGAASAKLLAEEGAFVFIADVSQDRGMEVVHQIGSAASFLKLNVADADDWNQAVCSVEKQFDRLDILVNSAGIVLPGKNVENTTPAEFSHVLAINTIGTFFGCKFTLPLLKRSEHASIINISSNASHQGYDGIAYGASKGAVRTMSKSLAVYCQRQAYSVRCNSIHPGGIESSMMEEVMMRVGDSRDVPPGILPFGRLGAPIDIAYAVLYLASVESRFITGEEILIDNGAVARPAVSPRENNAW